MTNKIVFILEGAHHIKYFPGILKRNGYNIPVIGNFSNESTLIETAKELIRSGTKVLISSGGYYETLVRSISIPVVSITRTWAGIPEAVAEARRLSDNPVILARRGVFLLASEQYKARKDPDIRLEKFHDEEDCLEILHKLKEEGCNVLICGSRGSRLAQPLGFEVIVLPFEEVDIIHSIIEAKHVLSYLETIERSNSMLKAIQNSVSTAIIATDNSNKIIEINNAALNALGETRTKITGAQLEETILAPIAKLENYQTNSAVTSVLLTINNQLMSVSLIPVTGSYPMTIITFSQVVRRSLAERPIKTELRRSGHIATYQFEEIIGQSSAIKAAINAARKYARVDSSILISAPTGCGKEMFAQSIHNSSRRRSMPFVVVNCAALPESLLESTLFGYEKGAYTGAAKEGRQGLFQIADGGTVFLDEISEMPLSLQSKFLRVLQEKEVTPLGSDRVIQVDVRIIAATNRNLYKMVEDGSFRQDLYFRLAVLELFIPPLNERLGDIALLARHFIFKHSETLSLPCPEITEAALTYLETLQFPGNVRQLENCIERLLVLNDGENPIDIALIKAATGSAFISLSDKNPHVSLAEIERAQLIDALRTVRGNRQKAAELLGISSTTLWRHLKKYGII